MSRYELRLAGDGGQGLVLAGLVLAEAALSDGKNALMTQSYGAQARGGPSRSEVIISDGEIDYPKVLSANLLLALSQDALDRHGRNVAKDALILVDASEVERAMVEGMMRFPFVETSRKIMGSEVGTGMVALGTVVQLTGIVSHRSLFAAIRHRVPAGTEEMNRRAVQAGFKLAQQGVGVALHSQPVLASRSQKGGR